MIQIDIKSDILLTAARARGLIETVEDVESFYTEWFTTIIMGDAINQVRKDEQEKVEIAVAAKKADWSKTDIVDAEVNN